MPRSIKPITSRDSNTTNYRLTSPFKVPNPSSPFLRFLHIPSTLPGNHSCVLSFAKALLQANTAPTHLVEGPKSETVNGFLLPLREGGLEGDAAALQDAKRDSHQDSISLQRTGVPALVAAGRRTRGPVALILFYSRVRTCSSKSPARTLAHSSEYEILLTSVLYMIGTPLARASTSCPFPPAISNGRMRSCKQVRHSTMMLSPSTQEHGSIRGESEAQVFAHV